MPHTETIEMLKLSLDTANETIATYLNDLLSTKNELIEAKKEINALKQIIKSKQNE